MLKINTSTYLFAIAVAVGIILIGYIIFAPKTATDPNNDQDPIVVQTEIKAEDLAQCLADAGVHFFHARWCSHCTTQKAMFGDSINLIDSTDCAAGETFKDGFTEECKNLGITSVPAWGFPDGTGLAGVQTFETLAEKAECVFEDPVVAGPTVEVSQPEE